MFVKKVGKKGGLGKKGQFTDKLQKKYRGGNAIPLYL